MGLKWVMARMNTCRAEGHFDGIENNTAYFVIFFTSCRGGVNDGKLSRSIREMVFKDQRGFAMLFSFQNSIDSVCFCFHAHRINTDLKTEQHIKTTLILKNQSSRLFLVLAVKITKYFFS